MRDSWLDETVGDEVSPRRGFEDELARELHQEWHGRQSGWRIAIWGTAAAILLAGVVVVLANRGDDDQLVPADSTGVTASVEPTPAPTTQAPSSTVLDSTTTSLLSTSLPPPTDEAGFTVFSYLMAMSEGRWDDAAQVLNQGGLEPEARADMRPLFRPEFGLVPGSADNEAVAAALQRWCDVSLCTAPLSVVTDGYRQIATWDVAGVQRSVTFSGFTFEGQPGVQGLPLQLPAGADLADTMACPTAFVLRQTWADLDGDGWLELVVVTRPTGDEATNVITVCGSTLEVTPLEIVDGEGVWAYAVNPAGTGADLLLMGSVPPFVSGTVYEVDGDHFVTMAGPDGDATFAFVGMLDTPDQRGGRATNCATVDGVPTLVNDTNEYVGGTELSNSTQVIYSRVNAVGRDRVESSGSFALPSEIDAAFEVIVGYCNGLPIMTGG